MKNDAHYPLGSPELNRLVEYNLVITWMEDFKKRGLISSDECSRAIKETNRRYKDVIDKSK
ncbi:hypothetical protein [Clostridium estertheticum]|uniref:Uncharacterized protein n=1 Tax=Clostridium estertheticum TaxID=238834 RepID=A0AA47I7F1_9CLOT|nr:hypothetical protein [Clostridium estertheticum]MBU3153473.1 hypothetical protein [Clostridium estertheticum]WAG60875.1 hypothetical protein LL038_01085 [Clostridium estertheticum]